MDPVTLRTDRLLLSAPEPADADDVVAYANDPDVIAYTPVPVPYGHAEARHWITEVVGTGWPTARRRRRGLRRDRRLPRRHRARRATRAGVRPVARHRRARTVDGRQRRAGGRRDDLRHDPTGRVRHVACSPLRDRLADDES